MLPPRHGACGAMSPRDARAAACQLGPRLPIPKHLVKYTLSMRTVRPRAQHYSAQRVLAPILAPAASLKHRARARFIRAGTHEVHRPAMHCAQICFSTLPRTSPRDCALPGPATQLHSNSAGQCIYVSELTFPHNQHAPVEQMQLLNYSAVALHRAFEFRPPEIHVGLRQIREWTLHVSMPETSVHKHHCPIASEHNVWTPRQAPLMKSKAKS